MPSSNGKPQSERLANYSKHWPSNDTDSEGLNRVIRQTAQYLNVNRQQRSWILIINFVVIRTTRNFENNIFPFVLSALSFNDYVLAVLNWQIKFIF